MKVSIKASKIEESPTLAISAKAAQLKKQGIPVIDFGVGEPDFDTPQNIKQEAISAINAGFTKYTPASGIPALKEAIAEKLKRDNGLEYSPQNIVVSCGAKHSLYNIMLALLNPGDEVIIPVPYWVTYPEQVKLCDGVCVFITADEKTEFKISAAQIEENISPKTKMIILNSPNNPSGAVYTRKELEEIASVAVKYDLIVVSDEVYEKIIYDDSQHISIASLGKEIFERTIVVNAVSKTYSMTGWRIGYCAGPSNVIKAIAEVQSHTTSNPTSISQKAALAAITGPQDFVYQMVSEFDRRRKFIVEELNKIDGIKCIKPKGAFYVFPKVSDLYGKIAKNSLEFSAYLLEEAKVAVVPGSAFGMDDYIRISYATSIENIKEGISRLKAALKKQ